MAATPTEKTSRPFGEWSFRRAPEPVEKPRAPGPLARKANQLAERVTRAVGPYGAVLAVAAIAGLITGWLWLFTLVAGPAIWHALLRVHEAYGWHRRGGKAAARKRRRYQGRASYRELRAKLSVRAVRKRINVTRPATENSHKLPNAEVGILIGQTVRRFR